jgi:hypothetical protein
MIEHRYAMMKIESAITIPELFGERLNHFHF